MKKIFVYGDSISMQYGFYLKEILERNNCEYDRKGGSNSMDLANPVWNGLSSNRMLIWIKEQPCRKDTILLFNCGLHDIVHTDIQEPCRVSIDTYKNNLVQICKMAEDLFSQIIFINTTPVDDTRHNVSSNWMRFNRDVITYNHVAKDAMDACRIPVIDLYTYTDLLKKEFDVYQDQVHMTGRASKLQAEMIAGRLMNWGFLDG